ncbi:hypothetical protein B7463_g1500, partial [Scytalidium lignicola]
MSIPKPNGPDVDIGSSMLGLCWTLYSIAGVVVAARTYTQLRITRQFGIGDIFMLISMMLGFTQMSLLTVSHHYGLGRHFFYLSDVLRVKAMEWEFIAEPFGPLCSMCGRTAFIILMFRLFGTTKLRRYLLYFLIAETIIINLVTCITIYTQCEKVETIWDPVGTPSRCWPSDIQASLPQLTLKQAANSLTDLILTALPFTIFWNLQMKLNLKIGLTALLGLSLFAFVSSIIKTVKLKSLGDRSDYSFNTVPFLDWVAIENTFVIIGASIPLLRPLFSKAKQQAMTAYGAHTAYEMNSRSQSGTKGPFSVASYKSIALQSSSEQNILPVYSVFRLTNNIESNNNFGDGHDIQKGIKKKTTTQIKYDEDERVLSSEPKSGFAK